MAVTARFVVSRISPSKDEDVHQHEVEMVPDYAQGRNEEWKAATPAGMFRLTIGHGLPALDQFEQGQPVHITIEKAE